MPAALHWLVIYQPEIGYGEPDPPRSDLLAHPWQLPIAPTDCSMTDAAVDKWLGLVNPATGTTDWSQPINTLTIGAHLPHLGEASEALPGDDVIYGLNGPLSEQHMAKIAVAGNDPLTVSHGWRGEPRYVYVSDGDPTFGRYGPPTFCRVDTKAVSPIAYPPNYTVPIVPGSLASKVAQFKPAGAPPTLRFGMSEPIVWIRFWRLIGREAGVWPVNEPVGPGGYGQDTERMTVRFERQQSMAPDGVVTPRVWLRAGVQG